MSPESTELKLFIDNDRDLYFGQRSSIVDNLLRKKNAGTYDSAKSVKLRGYLAESGAKKYVRGTGADWHRMFSVADRKTVARELRDDFEAACRAGEHASRQEGLMTRAQKKKKAKAKKKGGVAFGGSMPRLSAAEGYALQASQKVAFAEEYLARVNVDPGFKQAARGMAREALALARKAGTAGADSRERAKAVIRKTTARKKRATRKSTKKGQVRKTARRAYTSTACTKAKAEACFKKTIMPAILESETLAGGRPGRPDKPGRRQMWNDYIEGLRRDDTITEKQAYSWTHPSWLETYKGGRR